jgi:hypothetical protein
VLIAHGCYNADFPDASQYLSGNIGTISMIAKIFAQEFFAAVWRRQACLYNYRWNRTTPTAFLIIIIIIIYRFARSCSIVIPTL